MAVAKKTAVQKSGVWNRRSYEGETAIFDPLRYLALAVASEGIDHGF